ncbi:pyridoxamine kinase, partial [Vibrio mimicus]
MKSVVSIQRQELHGKFGNDLLVLLLEKMGLKIIPIQSVKISNHTINFGYIERKSENINNLDYSENEKKTNDNFSNFYIRLT